MSYICHDHFQALLTLRRSGVKIDLTEAQQVHAECPDCQKVRAEQLEKQSPRIDQTQPYGEHIYLTCSQHPHLRWTTKNIEYIGARSIFYRGSEVNGHLDPSVPECACSGRELRVLRQFHPAIVADTI